MSGEDIKLNCGAGSLDQYRYLYNANRATTVLIYNWTSGSPLIFDRLNRVLALQSKMDDHILERLLDPVQSVWELAAPEYERLGGLAMIDNDRNGLGQGEAVTSAEYFLSMASCVRERFKLTVLSQTALQEKFPSALEYLLQMTTDKATRPELPTTKVTRNSWLLAQQSDKDIFLHYRITFIDDAVVFGETYSYR